MPDDREGNLWLLVDGNNSSSLTVNNIDFASRIQGLSSNANTFGPRTSLINSQQPHANHEVVRIELDDIDPEKDISNLLDRIKAILDSRKRAT